MVSLRFFAAGFLIMATAHLLTTCGQDRSGNGDPGIKVDVEQIHEGARLVEEAFRSADPAAVRAVMTEEALTTYGADLETIKPRMVEFADAIATRRLGVYSELYAEYRYTANGRTLSFALAAQEDGVWKLVRF
jgi:hypothetical protein